MSLTIGGFQVTIKRLDPKKEAQEAAARGNWRPTDQMLRKADPDYVQRFFINEALKQDLRRQYRRAVLVNPGEAQERAQSRAMAFWTEYAALDERWIGDTPEIKRAVAQDSPPLGG